MAITASAERSGRAARARILEIAIAEFGTFGFHGTSLGRIAKTAGISQAGLIHHFANKAALLHAVLVERDTRALAEADAGVALEDLAFDELVAFFARVMDHNSKQRDVVALAHLLTAEATTPEHPAHDWVVFRQTYVTELFAGAVRRDIDEGRINADVDPTSVARTVIGLAEGLENLWLVDPRINLTSEFERASTLLVSALRGS